MDDRRPDKFAVFLVDAEIVFILFIVVIDFSLRVRGPNKLRHGIGKIPKLRFAFFQFLRTLGHPGFQRFVGIQYLLDPGKFECVRQHAPGQQGGEG